jgi:hypothetical protein
MIEKEYHSDYSGFDYNVTSDFTKHTFTGRAIAQAVAGFPPRRSKFEARSGHVEFVVGKVALGHVFAEYFRFPYQSSFYQLLSTITIIYHLGLVKQDNSDRSTKWTQSHHINNNNNNNNTP